MKQALLHLLRSARGSHCFPEVFQCVEKMDAKEVEGLYKMIKALLEEQCMTARNDARRKFLSGRMP